MEQFKAYAVYVSPISTKEFNEIKLKLPDQSISIAYDLFAELLVKCLKNSDIICSEYGLYLYQVSSQQDFEALIKHYAKPEEAYEYADQFNLKLKSYCVAIDLMDEVKKSLLNLYAKTDDYNNIEFENLTVTKYYNRSNLDIIRDEIDEEFSRIMTDFEDTANSHSIL